MTDQQDETPPVQSSKMWIYIIVGIILLLIVFAVIYFFKKKNNVVEVQKIEEEKKRGDEITKKLDAVITYQNEVSRRFEVLTTETNKKFDHISSRIDNIKIPREDKSRLKEIDDS